jgi:hypothetical protein
MGRTVRLALVVLALAGTVALAGPAPAQPAPESGSSDWRVVDVGLRHSCGIRTNGRLYCWGSDSHGKLGNGGANTDAAIPTVVSGGFTDWTSVALGGSHSCGRRANGRLYCWGAESVGELGNGGANADASVPTLVAGGFTDWIAVAAGGTHSCGLRSNHRIRCWGSDIAGQLGDGGEDVNRTVPRLVGGGITNWVSVTTGDSHTCARRANGRLYCWGYDFNGELGNGPATQSRPLPSQVAGGFTDWTSVSAGDLHTCGRRANGRLYCWGSDSDGQIGDDATIGNKRSSPTLVAGGATNWRGVSAGSATTCARRATGRLFCWGDDGYSELGNGGANTDASMPVQVAGGATDWATFDVGGATVCSRITSARLFCWGRDLEGQVGDAGTNTNQPRPVQVFAP